MDKRIHIELNSEDILKAITPRFCYTRQHHPSYYADDPRDMEILEEIKQETK